MIWHYLFVDVLTLWPCRAQPSWSHGGRCRQQFPATHASVGRSRGQEPSLSLLRNHSQDEPAGVSQGTQKVSGLSVSLHYDICLSSLSLAPSVSHSVSRPDMNLHRALSSETVPKMNLQAFLKARRKWMACPFLDIICLSFTEVTLRGWLGVKHQMSLLFCQAWDYSGSGLKSAYFENAKAGKSYCFGGLHREFSAFMPQQSMFVPFFCSAVALSMDTCAVVLFQCLWIYFVSHI